MEQIPIVKLETKEDWDAFLKILEEKEKNVYSSGDEFFAELDREIEKRCIDLSNKPVEDLSSNDKLLMKIHEKEMELSKIKTKLNFN